jgi:hypothetical protein
VWLWRLLQARVAARDELKALKDGELKALKEDVARKTQLIAHMKAQLTSATDTLAALETHLKASEHQGHTMQKQLVCDPFSPFPC